ncbi:CAP domain-containing protein [Planctomyces sp. SH-PL62]|uniref:CAP domain-containing protein n=1 Tax=Planctomyces sp. SH-PL62 TaxID=1636152 RepID=UPI00078C27CC|nr:CAP domain-containing protein [Planctomyces sp. SH-PL62]AMV37464.1 hypothetical protein VT85_08515 [Planctomyces sp. SH-PL62]
MSSPTIEPRVLSRVVLSLVAVIAVACQAEAQQYYYTTDGTAAPTQPAPTYIYQTAPAVQYVQQPEAAQVYQGGYVATEVAAQPVQAEAAPAASYGDPYGFVNWLNGVRASYGLGAVGHDPNLSSWAAMNNNQQAAQGLGHHVMGPARRQNSAMGGFPGIEAMWMASPAHRAALLDPTITWVGIAGAGAWWTFNAN